MTKCWMCRSALNNAASAACSWRKTDRCSVPLNPNACGQLSQCHANAMGSALLEGARSLYFHIFSIDMFWHVFPLNSLQRYMWLPAPTTLSVVCSRWWDTYSLTLPWWTACQAWLQPKSEWSSTCLCVWRNPTELLHLDEFHLSVLSAAWSPLPSLYVTG